MVNIKRESYSSVPFYSLSASKVDCFMGCPRLFLYRYLRKPFDIQENKYFALGNLVHKTLEVFHLIAQFGTMVVPTTTATGQRAPFDPTQAAELMKYAFYVAMQQEGSEYKFRLGILSKEDLQSAKNMLKNYLKTVNWNATTVGVEIKFIIDIEGIEVHGKIDRVELDGNVLRIIDYKTNKRPYSEKEVEESVQLSTYSRWVEQSKNKIMEHFGVESIIPKYEYNFLLSQKKREYTVSEASLRADAEKYKKTMSAVRSGKGFHQNFRYKMCGLCDYKGYCLEDKKNDITVNDDRCAECDGVGCAVCRGGSN